MTQAWTDVKASRKLNTPYQNATGASIQVNVATSGTGTAALRVAYTDNFSADDIQVGLAGDVLGGSMSATVPASSWYMTRVISGAPAIAVWSELR